MILRPPRSTLCPYTTLFRSKDGKPTHSFCVGQFDGKAYPVKGNLPYNSVAYKVVNDRTNDITAMKDGKIGWNGRITVSADGKSRTVNINGTDAQGKKINGKAVYDKEEKRGRRPKTNTAREWEGLGLVA